ncbi:DeoR/GlpR family DNA-binding transcription regulator [Nocardia sp. NPDC005745]|uniref:DeoR/GlpR family DNA-binding transcription regulator n=1 Tax=Nocardia sp. NPDC005745 TaxID=3157061 RepID=UPI0033F5F912
MLASTRRREILSRLFAEGYVEAKQLAGDLGVDISTIRRDLDSLERVGQVQRTHGGARPLPGVAAELPYATKKAEHLAEKAALAEVAARRVTDGDTVVLDSGSTTYEVAVALRNHSELTVITNDLRIAKYIAAIQNFRLLVTGGELLGSVFTLVGERAVDFLRDYTADWTFLGADAVDADAGITNTNTLELPIKRTMLAVARTSIVVADHAKFGHRALAKVAGLAEVDAIITDSGLADDVAAKFGDKLIRADP